MTGKFGSNALLKTTTAIVGTLGSVALLAGLPAPAFGQVIGSEQIPGSPDSAENGSNGDSNTVEFVDISGDGTTVIGFHNKLVNNLPVSEAWVFTPTGATVLTAPTGYLHFTPAGISEWSVSTSATYTHDMGNGNEGFIRAEYLFESDTQVVDNVSAAVASREVNVLNLSAGVDWENGFTVMAWARNLTDDRYYLSAFPTVIQPGSFSGYLSPPRTFGVTVRKSF